MILVVQGMLDCLDLKYSLGVIAAVALRPYPCKQAHGFCSTLLESVAI